MQIDRVWVDDHAAYASTTDGQQALYEFCQWPRLRDTSPEQRASFELTCIGIHWPAIVEDLSFEGMFHKAGLCPLTVAEDSVIYVVNNR